MVTWMTIVCLVPVGGISTYSSLLRATCRCITKPLIINVVIIIKIVN